MGQPVPRSVLTAYDRNVDHGEIDGEGIELALELEHLCHEHGLSPDIVRTELVRAVETYEAHSFHTHRSRKPVVA